MSTIFILGRIIVGLYFLENAYRHLVSPSHLAEFAKARGVPQPRLAVIGSGTLLLLGGLSLLTGMYVHLGTILLIVFLLPVTIMMHAFWKLQDPQARAMERIAFMKNIALVGFLLMMTVIFSPVVVG
jgi:uncharacterized membrane protein YphA (DoxX/SURF4 family)